MQSSAEKTVAGGRPSRTRIPARFAGEMVEVLSDIMSVENLDHALQKIAKAIADLFSVKALVIAVLDENEQVFRIRAAHGFEAEREAKIKKIVYSAERLRKDIGQGVKVVENVYLVRPPPGKHAKGDEAFYSNIQDINSPRSDDQSWHELDYLLLLFTDRNGQISGYIEIDEPSQRKVPDRETVEAMQVFSRLASVAIENAKLFQGQVEVAQRSRYLGDIISHDINNYNQAVTSYIQMALSSGDISDKVAKYLERASTSAWGISQLIQRANKLVQIEEEGASGMGPVDLSEVLRESMENVRRNYADADVVINLNKANHRYYVVANQLCGEIFENILSNAVDYDPHERIVVDVSISELSTDSRRYWCVSVADNGIGIPDSKKNVVFGRFSPAESRAPGSGLGLSIVRAIVEAYKGMVWVEDRVPGETTKGSVFRVALPAAVSKR